MFKSGIFDITKEEVKLGDVINCKINARSSKEIGSNLTNCKVEFEKGCYCIIYKINSRFLGEIPVVIPLFKLDEIEIIEPRSLKCVKELSTKIEDMSEDLLMEEILLTSGKLKLEHNIINENHIVLVHKYENGEYEEIWLYELNEKLEMVDGFKISDKYEELENDNNLLFDKFKNYRDVHFFSNDILPSELSALKD